MEQAVGIDHPLRISARDIKLRGRDLERASRLGYRRCRCPCRICIFGRPLLLSTQARHLEDFGRHPLRRQWTQVQVLLTKSGLQLCHKLMSPNYVLCCTFPGCNFVYVHGSTTNHPHITGRATLEMSPMMIGTPPQTRMGWQNCKGMQWRTWTRTLIHSRLFKMPFRQPMR